MSPAAAVTAAGEKWQRLQLRHYSSATTAPPVGALFFPAFVRLGGGGGHVARCVRVRELTHVEGACLEEDTCVYPFVRSFSILSHEMSNYVEILDDSLRSRNTYMFYSLQFMIGIILRRSNYESICTQLYMLK